MDVMRAGQDGHRQDSRPSDPAIPALVRAACGVSLLLGLTFVFVRAPHPWGWEGFDGYRDLGLALARGEQYPTLEVPWGYPIFLALFYRVFGDRQWVPLIVQVLLNSLIPAMVFAALRDRAGHRSAIAAAALLAVLSFNTVYASTQTSDSLATVLFVAATVLFLHPQRTRRIWHYVAGGLVVGAAIQVRPNMLLLPLWFTGAAALIGRPRPSMAAVLAYVAAACVVVMPWT